jgi:hypothetical protein
MVCVVIHRNVMHRFRVQALQDPPLCSSTDFSRQHNQPVIFKHFDLLYCLLCFIFSLKSLLTCAGTLSGRSLWEEQFSSSSSLVTPPLFTSLPALLFFMFMYEINDKKYGVSKCHY